jgi:predicted ATPase
MHWADSSTWALVIDMVSSLSGVAFMLSSRPLIRPFPVDYLKIMKLPSAQHLSLEALSREATVSLLSMKLQAHVISPAIQDMFYKQTQGHPLYVEELLRTLKAKKLIEVSGGEVLLMGTGKEKDFTTLPESVERIIVDRIDHLPPKPELTVKVCGVLGRDFSLKLLTDVHPSGSAGDELKDQMTFLVDNGILNYTAHVDPRHATYSFKYGYFQNIAYFLLLLQQRKQIHERVAIYHETFFAGHLSPYFSLIAHNWEKADQVSFDCL